MISMGPLALVSMLAAACSPTLTSIVFSNVVGPHGELSLKSNARTRLAAWPSPAASATAATSTS